MQHHHPRRGGIISGLLFAGMVVFMAVFLVGVLVTRTIHVRSVHTDDGGGK